MLHRSTFRRGLTLAPAFTLFFAWSAAADPAADRCGSDKLKATGRLGQSYFTCEATATRRGEAVDPACTAKASGKLATSFARAEATGACASVDDAADVEASVVADVAAIVDLLASGIAPEEAPCAAAKIKAAGKLYSGTLGCWSKGARASEGPDPACLSRASDKAAKAFEKAEAKGSCAAGGGIDVVESAIGLASAARVAELSPVCGDEVVGPGQECEPASDAACPGACTPACECDVPPVCGDGVAELPEECDDGDEDDGDGCSATCTLEDASALCAGVASSTGTALGAVLVSDAVDQPMHAAAPPLDPSRLFVVERPGRVRIVDLEDDSVLPTPFLDISDLVDTAGEGGLLSIAFHPDYRTNRRFFVNYTNLDGDTTIARYEASLADPDVADESSARVLLVIEQPFSNHNGGQVAFGSDGRLYVGMGDGGGGGDPLETAQDDGSLLGKMLRLDVDVETLPWYAVPTDNPGYVDGSDPLELIWSKGLRNPWRFSFDRANGDLLVADVGQGSLEEVNLVPASSTGGENYGWDIFEGSACYEPDPAPVCPAVTGFTMPIHEYPHSEGCSISGGHVYRGCALTDLAGTYFYSDFCSAFIRTFDVVGGAAVNPQDRSSDVGVDFGPVVSFAEDARGELYVLDITGSVYRIVAD